MAVWLSTSSTNRSLPYPFRCWNHGGNTHPNPKHSIHSTPDITICMWANNTSIGRCWNHGGNTHPNPKHSIPSHPILPSACGQTTHPSVGTILRHCKQTVIITKLYRLRQMPFLKSWFSGSCPVGEIIIGPENPRKKWVEPNDQHQTYPQIMHLMYFSEIPVVDIVMTFVQRTNPWCIPYRTEHAPLFSSVRLVWPIGTLTCLHAN